MTKLQRRERKRDSRRSQRERTRGSDSIGPDDASFFHDKISSSPSSAATPSRIVSLLSQLRPMPSLERRLQRLSIHDTVQRWLPPAAVQAQDETASLPEELPAKLIVDLPAELPAGFQEKIAGLSSEPPAKPPAELPAEPVPKKPNSSLSSPSLSSLFPWAPPSSSIMPTQQNIAEFEKSFHSSLPALQILNTTEPIPPHNVTEVFSVVRYKSTIIDTVSIFVMKHTRNESNRSVNFVLSCPLSLNDVTSICKYPLRSSLSGSRTLYEVAIPPQVASALMAFEICDIAYGDTIAERELLPHTISRTVRPFQGSLVRGQDSTLYRYGRPLCELMFHALLNRNEAAARWFWEELIRLTKISRQYDKLYHKMSSCVEDQLRRGCSSNEKQADSWGPEHSWLRFWIIDRVNPYRKFPISSLTNIDRGVEREFLSFMRGSSGRLARNGTVAEDQLEGPDEIEWIQKQGHRYSNSNEESVSSEFPPYVHNVFTQASLYVDDNSSTCESEYFDVDQQPADKSENVLASADQKHGEGSGPIHLIDRIYSFWSYRERSARRKSVRW